MEYQIGQWVRLKADYGANSDDKMDKAAAGLVGKLLWIIDNNCGDTLWGWETGNGLLYTCPCDSEIEEVVYE